MPKRSWPNGWRRPEFDGNGDTQYGWRCSNPDRLFLEMGVDIGYGTYIQSQECVTIEEDVQIGGHCRIYSVDTERGISAPVRIGVGCNIGSATTILPGVVLPPGTNVPAHSLVLPGEIRTPQWKVRRI